MSQASGIAPELASALVDNTPDAMIFAGTDGMIGGWNPAAEKIFGHTAAEAIGQSLDLIIPERFRNAHWTAYDKALEAGHTKGDGTPTITQAIHKNGETMYIEVGFRLIVGGEGKPLGAMASARDATERFNREREMRRELKELKEAAKG